MLKAIIVEDEPASRETLRNYINKYCKQVHIAEEAESVKTGLEAIKKHSPDLVFLDVEMPYGNAFDLLDQVEEKTFETIFVTAFDHYAMKALNFSASYYILKPIDIDELVKAVDMVAEKKESKEHALRTKVLIDNIKIENKQLQKIILPLLDGFEVVTVKDILHCRANDNFTEFYLSDGSKQMICRTLKFYDELLSDLDFIRVHKSHLVNLQYIKRYKKGKGGQVILSDGTAIDVSSSRKNILLEKFR
ncbi:MAG: LytTR family DNA-binding domain-containing protein [Bacteroidales bacterium]|jgi:two-component system LytT family response regulator